MKHDFWNKIKQNGYEVLEISSDLVESYNKWLSEEGEAPITATAGIEPKDQPVIEGKKKKKKKKNTVVQDNAKKWVKIGPVSRWGYGLYGVSPDGNESGDSGGGDSGGGGM